jgi:hypothetical protein
MNAEFKRMMELAGLTEIKVNPPNQYNVLWKNYINQESIASESLPQEIINKVKKIIELYRYKEITSLYDLVENIETLEEDTIDIIGSYDYDFSMESKNRLKDVCDKLNFSQKEELFDILRKNYRERWDYDEDDELHF